MLKLKVMLAIIIASILLNPIKVFAACTSLPYTFTNGSVADANQMMSNLNYITGCTAPVASPAFTGSVGIGTSTATGILSVGAPSAALAAISSSTATSLTLTSLSNGSFYMEDNAAATSGSGAHIVAYQNGGSVMTTGVRLGGIIIGGASSSVALRNAASVSAYADDNWVDGSDYGAYLSFSTTTDGTTARSEKMRVAANGGIAIGTTYVLTNPPANGAIIQGIVGIGTASPSSTFMLQVNGSVGSPNFVNTSDIRRKKNIQPLSIGLKEIEQLKPVTFEWKDDTVDQPAGKKAPSHPLEIGMQGKQIGFIAQDIERILPSVVVTENNTEKTKGMKYSEIIAILVKAIQEQEAEINNLKSEIDALKKTK